MADKYLLEDGVSRYLLEDGTSFYLLEPYPWHIYGVPCANLVTSSAGDVIAIPADVPVGAHLYVAVTSRDHTSLLAQPTVTDDGGGAAWSIWAQSADRKATIFRKTAEAGTAGATITVASLQGGSAFGLTVIVGGAEPSAAIISDNASGVESVTGFTPAFAGSHIVLVVFNTANDEAVTSPACTDPGALFQYWEHRSTGGSDAAVTVAGMRQVGGPTATGNFTWAQSNNTTITMVFEIPPATEDRRAQLYWAEMEVPNAPRRAQVYWAEMEVPNAPRRAQVYWAEMEVPTAPRRAQVYWAEMEVPNAPRRAQVYWAELEVPNAPRRAQVYWAEMEVPDAPSPDRRAQVYWSELEVPNAPRRAQVYFAELEVPNAPRRAQVYFAEMEVPNAPRRAQVYWVELEVPNAPVVTNDRRCIITWTEMQVPDPTLPPPPPPPEPVEREPIQIRAFVGGRYMKRYV